MTEKPNPHPTPNRLAFARDIARGFVIQVDGQWHNSVTGRRCNAAVAEFGDLLTARTDTCGHGIGVTRARLTNDGQQWLDTYGKNGPAQ